MLGASSVPISGHMGETTSQVVSRGNWLYVGGSGPGNYTGIQQAIDNASAGDTVFVFNGTYVGHLNINKVGWLVRTNHINIMLGLFLKVFVCIWEEIS